LGGSYHEGWQRPAKQLLSSQELAFIGRQLGMADAAHALDVGIGNGRILEYLLGRTSHTTFHGVDFAQAMVEVCRVRFADEPRVAELARCDVAREPIPFTRQFDLVSAIRVLKYSPNWPAVLETLVRKVAPGGTLVFSMPNRISINRFSKPYAVPWYTTTPAELRKRCDSLDVAIVEMLAFPRLPYAAYDRAEGRALQSLVAVEHALAACCGRTFLGRELFVAARKA
jgi:SAM-dependent methyltransferase